jgi:hypothetical protein
LFPARRASADGTNILFGRADALATVRAGKSEIHGGYLVAALYERQWAGENRIGDSHRPPLERRSVE